MSDFNGTYISRQISKNTQISTN